MRRPLLLLLLVANAAYAEDLRLESVRHSLTGTHLRYRKFANGIPILGEERVMKLPGIVNAPSDPETGALVYVNVSGKLRLASRSVTGGMIERYAEYRDVKTNELLRKDALFYSALARVFEPNPVVKLNDSSLRDRNDAADAIPTSAYNIVDLSDLAPSGPLAGPNVQIVDIDSPSTVRADSSQPLLFTRDQQQFEEVNAYFHIDRSQRYLRSLGFTGARAVVAYAIPVDAHAVSRADNSYYVGDTHGRGTLYFGDGGTDDAEDSDIMLHEFAHAIHDWIAPDVFNGPSGSEARAMAEGIGDYWAFSAKYAHAMSSGRDPFCIGDWDARCGDDDAGQNCSYPRQADCLRRVDQPKTMADFIPFNTSGMEHVNGEIWSATLRDVFLGLTSRYGVEQGRRLADTIIIESLFGATSDPTFGEQGVRLLAADAALNSGANAGVICRALTARGILATTACGSAPRGDVTFYPSATATVQVLDARPIDDLAVRVLLDDITSQARVMLIAPDGNLRILSARPSTDATYGFDTPSKDSLASLFGRPAAGEWKLVIEGARLRSWALKIRFAGAAPMSARPFSGQQRKHIPVVAHAIGAANTLFVTDLVLHNKSASAAAATVIFTPSGVDGNTTFTASVIFVAPRQTVVIEDVVGSVLQSSGLGQLELIGDTDRLIVTSRTHSPARSGSYAQTVPAFDTLDAGAETIGPVENSAAFRANIGVAEAGGGRGTVRFEVFDGDGVRIGATDVNLAPFSHAQQRLPFAGTNLRIVARVIDGDPRIFAYASVVDNLSGDAVTIPAQRVLSTPATVAIPVIHGEGSGGTTWRTDEWRVTSSTATVRRDVGAILGVELGALFVESSGTIVASRTYTPSDRGTYGQYIPALTPGTTGEPLQMIGVDQSAGFRTNVGLINFALVPAVATVIVYDGAGVELGRQVVTIAPRALQQLPLTAIVSATVDAGRVEVRAAPSVAAYASVINKGTEDPFYIVGQH